MDLEHKAIRNKNYNLYGLFGEDTDNGIWGRDRTLLSGLSVARHFARISAKNVYVISL